MGDGLSAAVRANLIALQRLASDIGRGQNRLATGKKINTPSDGPAAYFTASALSARAAALNSVLDGIGGGKKVIEAANAGIEGIQSLIKNARSLAYQALTSASTLAKVTGTVNGLTGATAISMDDGDTITVSDGTTTATYTHAGGKDVQDFIDEVNNTANLDVEARLTSDGRIEFEATGVNSVTIAGSASAGELNAIGLAAGTTTSSTNSLRQALAQQFDTIRTQINELAGDASYNGQNLLAGSTVSITLNETGGAAATVSGTQVTALSLGIASASSAGGNFQFDDDIEDFIADLDVASAQLQQMSSTYSAELSVVSVREDFTKAMANLLTDGAERLVGADMDYEGAMLLALKTRRDLAATTLSLAAEAEKTTLRLFGVG
jgi:flagellin